MVVYVTGLFRGENGYVVAKNAVVPSLMGGDATKTIIILEGARVQGPVSHPGRVVVSKGAIVEGDIWGGTGVILATGAKVQGNLRSEGSITIQSGATCEDVHANADVRLMGECHVGDVDAGGDVVIVGRPKARQLRPTGRVRTQ